MTLHPGWEYRYSVEATNSSGTATDPSQNFTTSSHPSIESESLSHLTSTDATLEAEINTEGLETTYQFKMWESPCSHRGSGCELIMNVPLPSGKLLGSFVSQSVSLDLNGAGVTLTPGGEYGYSVTATNAAGSVEGSWHQFEPPLQAPPSIESESAAHITPTDATLEAQINPNGAATAYFFEIDTIRSDNFTHPNCPFGPCESITVGPPLPAGLIEPPLEEIPALTGSQSVKVDMASIGATLQPGTTYFYRVIAHDAFSYQYPPAYGPEQSFTTPSESSGAGSQQSGMTGQVPSIKPLPSKLLPRHKKVKHRRHSHGSAGRRGG